MLTDLKVKTITPVAPNLFTFQCFQEVSFPILGYCYQISAFIGQYLGQSNPTVSVWAKVSIDLLSSGQHLVYD